MECGEQREGLGRHKRAIGLLFLEWLAANLNPHPCRRLRIAQKPRPPASHPLLRPGTAQRLRWPWAAAREGKGALSVLRGRVSVSPEAAVPWHERPFPCSARSCPRSRIAPAARAVGAGGWWMVDVDGLFVCNSHIGVHGKEAMTQTGRARCDGDGMRDEAALHLHLHLHGGSSTRRRSRPIAVCCRPWLPAPHASHRHPSPRANTPEGVCSCPNTCASSQQPTASTQQPASLALYGSASRHSPRSRADQTVQRYS